MHRRYRRLAALLVCLSFASVALGEEKSATSSAQLDTALAFLREGRNEDCRRAIARLLEEHPDYYSAYPYYWQAAGSTLGGTERRATVAEDLRRLERVPRRKRTEEFYSATIYGYSLVGNDPALGQIKQEALSRYPHGNLARGERLSAAHLEPDPVRAARLLAAIEEDFSEDVLLAEKAADARFDLLAAKPELFDKDTLIEGATTLERLSLQSAEQFGDTYVHVRMMEKISDALAEKAARDSVSFAERGLAYLEQHWYSTPALDERERLAFWSSMLHAFTSLEEWELAPRLADALLPQLEEEIPEGIRGRAREPRARRDYALVLEQGGETEKAREQIARSAGMDPGYLHEREAFFQRHPLGPAQRRRFETKITSLLKPQRDREARLKQEVLSHRELRPAPPFRLPALQGESVSLSSFHGRVLVLSFWATWCVPCTAEMAELEEASHRYARNPQVGFMGISVDRDRSLVEFFVKRRGYTFPILLTDGSVEIPYKTGAIPRLYVIDPQGRIRFSQGLGPFDGFQGKRLDWMIEAALK